MRVFHHHIYEYEKGLRSLVLHTLSAQDEGKALRRLQHRGIAYHVQPLPGGRVNLFFGDPCCIEVVKRICCRSLRYLTPEEDFILGTMLGYSRLVQCRRYLERSARTSAALPKAV